jgi:hypothetical protein
VDSRVDDAWLLDSVVTQVFTRVINSAQETEKDYKTTKRQTPKDFGRITFSELDGKKYGVGE